MKLNKFESMKDFELKPPKPPNRLKQPKQGAIKLNPMAKPSFKIIQSRLLKEDLVTNRSDPMKKLEKLKNLKLYAMQRAHVFSFLDLKTIIKNTSKLNRVDRDMLINHQFSGIIT